MIRASEVRLIGADGEQVGIMPLNEALNRAAEANLDLVEVAPQASPPVCRVMDYGKFKSKYYRAKRPKRLEKNRPSSRLRKLNLDRKLKIMMLLLK